jgi:hypothetical protein
LVLFQHRGHGGFTEVHGGSREYPGIIKSRLFIEKINHGG